MLIESKNSMYGFVVPLAIFQLGSVYKVKIYNNKTSGRLQYLSDSKLYFVRMNLSLSNITVWKHDKEASTFNQFPYYWVKHWYLSLNCCYLNVLHLYNLIDRTSSISPCSLTRKVKTYLSVLVIAMLTIEYNCMKYTLNEAIYTKYFQAYCFVFYSAQMLKDVFHSQRCLSFLWSMSICWSL